MCRPAAGATMTPAAPSSMAWRARRSRWRFDGWLTPTTTGTRPSTRLRMRVMTVAVSASVSLDASPIMPRMVSPATSLSR
ncbi:Uncharacterised protein [Bordetella pertussis]|nr:Uncharacterised protein [Bordetella pertussis]